MVDRDWGRGSGSGFFVQAEADVKKTYWGKLIIIYAHIMI